MSGAADGHDASQGEAKQPRVPEDRVQGASEWRAPGRQVMNLSHSGLSGQLPLAWGGQLSLPALRTLDLSGNGLQGAYAAAPPPLLSLLPHQLT